MHNNNVAIIALLSRYEINSIIWCFAINVNIRLDRPIPCAPNINTCKLGVPKTTLTPMGPISYTREKKQMACGRWIIKLHNLYCMLNNRTSLADTKQSRLFRPSISMISNSISVSLSIYHNRHDINERGILDMYLHIYMHVWYHHSYSLLHFLFIWNKK